MRTWPAQIRHDAGFVKEVDLLPHCCICASTDDVVWCDLCGHRFCARHRTLLWGYGQRTLAAVKQLILRMPPPHCAGNHDR